MKSSFQTQITGITSVASIVMDALRLSAAFVVLCHHAQAEWFPAELNTSKQLVNLAHASVTVFFVLSGYIIAYTVNKRNRGKRDYAYARLSRLCSVAIPALIFTGIAEIIVKVSAPVLYESYTRGPSWPRYFLSGFFLNEVWFLSAAPPMNGPLWSLSFEFWYYAIFGLSVYRGTGKKWWLLPLMACLVAGPKILLMMPVWLLGCLAYYIPKPNLASNKAALYVVLSFMAAGLFILYLKSLPFPLGYKLFYMGSQFITDWVVGFFMALGLWFLSVCKEQTSLRPFANKFRKVADLTFPIYALHYPLLKLFPVFFRFQYGSSFQMWQAIGAVLCASVLLGLFLEKYRSRWRELFERLFGSRLIHFFQLKTLHVN